MARFSSQAVAQRASAIAARSVRQLGSTLLAVLAVVAPVASAQAPLPEGMTVTPSGMRVNSRFIPAGEASTGEGLRLVSPERPAPPAAVPTFSGDRQVIALASALGGQMSVVYGKETVGSNLDPYTRQTLAIPDNSLDRIVLRGLDRTVERSFPDSERVFMRLNPVLLDDVPAPQENSARYATTLALALRADGEGAAHALRWVQRSFPAEWLQLYLLTATEQLRAKGALGPLAAAISRDRELAKVYAALDRTVRG
jgi:hypothetical protein